MSANMGDKISAEERATVGASLVLLAPPKQTREVVQDVRILVGENDTIEKKIQECLLKYAKEQTLQVTLPGSSMNTLITEHGDLGGQRFFCPRYHKSFKLDPLTHSVDDLRDLEPDDAEGGSIELEPWRSAVEGALTCYMRQNYPDGAVSVFAPASGKKPSIIIYIESSLRRPRFTGRWRSRWTVNIPNKIERGTCQVSGEIKIQTHVFEEGNVQFFSSKSFDFKVVANSPDSFGQDLCSKITSSDADYQAAIGENLDNMSSSSVKALRRPLPMTHDKIDWNKIASYQVGDELSRATSVASPTSSS